MKPINNVNKAVFIDRDGTICHDVGYCSSAEAFEMLSTAPSAIKLLNDNNFKVVMVTNQSGLARGYFTHDTLTSIHDRMRTELAAEGARIDAIYYCPHHPNDRCGCRKPNTGLFTKAMEDLSIASHLSFMVGDTQGDIDAGRNAGCKTILVTTGPSEGNHAGDPPDMVSSSLLEAVQWILRQ